MIHAKKKNEKKTLCCMKKIYIVAYKTKTFGKKLMPSRKQSKCEQERFI